MSSSRVHRGRRGTVAVVRRVVEAHEDGVGRGAHGRVLPDDEGIPCDKLLARRYPKGSMGKVRNREREQHRIAPNWQATHACLVTQFLARQKPKGRMGKVKTRVHVQHRTATYALKDGCCEKEPRVLLRKKA